METETSAGRYTRVFFRLPSLAPIQMAKESTGAGRGLEHRVAIVPGTNLFHDCGYAIVGNGLEGTANPHLAYTVPTLNVKISLGIRKKTSFVDGWVASSIDLLSLFSRCQNVQIAIEEGS